MANPLGDGRTAQKVLSDHDHFITNTNAYLKVIMIETSVLVPIVVALALKAVGV